MSSRPEEGAENYVQANATLRALYEERMLRDHARRWDKPDDFELGPDIPPLRLCSLPGRFLGAQVWLSGHLLARFLAAGRCPALSGDTGSTGARCLELGAGVGVAGLAAVAAGGAAFVMLTDKEEMLPLLRHNIQLNGLSERCKADTLVWGAAPPIEWGAFDVVIAADVIYPTKDPTALFALRDTIFSLCPPGSTTTFILAYHERAEEDRAFVQNEILPHFHVTVEEVMETELLANTQLAAASGSPEPGPIGASAESRAGLRSCQVYTCRRI